ncbi:MAG: hypothetical protein KDD45_14130 [Bdellovibrionales bacterium]|nr:hypothetical protein [Bdellovibrionales bacterium]
MDLQQINRPVRSSIEIVPQTLVSTAPIDSFAAKRISIKKQSDNYSTLSPKATTFGKSTKYQTLMSGPQSTITKNQQK